ncbi:hypothetical protein [Micromonospora fulviviridis]|uniref:Uncharacterized protein n=1 Tax=Micromonospora fulviviridis TaxID=47860 RepID=A0ABV2VFZ0_9ACTN
MPAFPGWSRLPGPVTGSGRSSSGSTMPWRVAISSTSARSRRTSAFSSSCSACAKASSSTISRLAKCAVISGMTSSTMVEMSSAARNRPASEVGEMSP